MPSVHDRPAASPAPTPDPAASRTVEAAIASQFAVLDLLPDAVAVLTAVRDASGVIVDERIDYANPAWLAAVHGRESIGGMTRETVLGRTILEVVPEVAARLELHRGVIDDRRPARREAIELVPGGWYDIEYTPFGDGLISVARDVTERVRAVRALRESEERWRFAVEGARDGMWDWDVTGGRSWLSRRWKEMLGEPDDGVGPAFEDFAARVHPDDLASITAALQRHLDGETPHYSARFRMRHADGHWVWILARATVVARDAGGRSLRVIGTHTDISELMAVEESLRISELRYRALVEGVPGIVYSYSTTRGGLYYSPHCLDILGYAPERLLAEPMLWHDSIHPDDLAMVEASITSAEFDEPVDVVYRVRDAHGAWRWLDDRSIRTQVRPGEVLLEGFALDVTARKRAEAEREQLAAQLEQAQKLESIGRLAGGVAHDFNNMLGAIIGHADMALEAVGADSPVRADLEEIRSAANRSADLTRQLLAFARKQTVAPRVLDLNAVIAGQLALLRRLIGEEIALDWRPGADVRTVKMDASQVDQLLANLCVNARDAIDGFGRIDIATANATPAEVAARFASASAAGGYVRLTVTDDGAGMGPEVLARIFEPFFTTKRQGEGTGLGLATVHGIANQNDGWVDVRSAPGKGSRFDVFLPAHVGAEADLPPETHAEAGGDGATILLVEDEAVILRLTASMLTRLGYRVLTASAPSVALQLAAEHAGEIGLLVTDVVMPEMNGSELVRLLLAQRPGLPHLYISGYTADVIAQHGVLGEGVHFLQKPFTAATLHTAVRQVLKAAPAAT